ncbi:MAG TPA: M50 family metallopeptidase [Candidatus Saccharimonadales bacterium]
MGTILFILGIILFIALVVVHELGHAIAAKRSGVEVEEFGIGFPPRAWKKKLKNGVLLTLNWLPLGGFVKLKGESDDAKGKGAYGAATLWVKTKILLAGVVMNWVAAAALFTILALAGLPQVFENQFTIPQDTQVVSQKVVTGDIGKGSPAEKAGLKTNDQIVSIAGETVNTITELQAATKRHAGQNVAIAYVRAGEAKTTEVRLRPLSAQNGQLGTTLGEQVYRRSTWSAPIVGIGVTAQFSWETVKGIGGALANVGQGLLSKLSNDASTKKAGDAALHTAGSSVAGPVGIVNFLLQTAQNSGFIGVMFIIAILSLTLAVMNILPIPALDGGRLFVTLLFRAMKKPLTKEKEESINATGFLALMGLFVFITILDITKLFGK